jgi:hypothetical protein
VNTRIALELPVENADERGVKFHGVQFARKRQETPG